MKRRLEVDFLDEQGKTHCINFWIFNTDLAQRWVELVTRGANDPSKYIHSSLGNVSAKSIPKIHARLNAVIESINNQSTFNLPKYQSIGELNTSELNNLHEKFEEYGAHVDVLHSKSLHDDFIELNELIHTCEEVVKEVAPDMLPVMYSQFDFYPQTDFSPILEEDKLFLETELKWGEVYLGYNTLGKDWLKVCLDNDIEVINRDMVKPQRRFSAETFINFGPDSISHYVQRTFSNWYKTLPEEIQKKIPINNLNELCLGRFVVGRVIIDNYFLQFNEDREAWLGNNSDAKRQWNNDVFSTFTKIINVKIKEDA